MNNSLMFIMMLYYWDLVTVHEEHGLNSRRCVFGNSRDDFGKWENHFTLLTDVSRLLVFSFVRAMNMINNKGWSFSGCILLCCKRRYEYSCFGDNEVEWECSRTHVSIRKTCRRLQKTPAFAVLSEDIPALSSTRSNSAFSNTSTGLKEIQEENTFDTC